ncbi:MAG: tRNA 4-thiouridine(8) synthase ThiI [Candidatus Omnitrophota bacterium]|jgi:tRNA U34 2-thiouridine synthase MnmA/TrmU
MKAIALISGGLDGLLAAKFIKEEGIEVIGIRFGIPFSAKPGKAIADIGIEVREADICEDFLKLVEKPAHGRGSLMNPCIDCKILMLKKAEEIMCREGAKFIITGEVLGQRPMSQHKEALGIIAKASGLEGLILRPLSAKLLEESIPEKEGWVRRGNLLGFSGRGRKAQIDLAGKLGIQNYAQPAGGCLLTDPGFSRRLKDLIAHEGLSREGVELLKIGRHFRLNDKARLVVGRDEKENERLLNSARDSDYMFMPGEDIAGPTSLGRGVFDEGSISFSCGITCGYCDINSDREADILCKRGPGGEERVFRVSPIARKGLSGIRV